MSHSFDPGLEEIYQKILTGDKVFLSRAITWVESTNNANRKRAIELLARFHQNPPSSIRIAVTGPPGAGKSTLIEVLGSKMIDKGYKVAVLAIDPTSSESYGSILGDKTRMKQLATNPEAFIRPSPTGLELGGVNNRTRESMMLCEAAGYNVIFIETVGVGQSEIMAKTMSDLFLLVLNPGGGDDLQGIKKGVVEMADLIVINKADGALIDDARRMKSAMKQSIEMKVSNDLNEKKIPLLLTSALEGFQIETLIKEIFDWVHSARQSNYFQENRLMQLKQWYKVSFTQYVTEAIMQLDIVKEKMDENYIMKIVDATFIPETVLRNVEEIIHKLTEKNSA